MPIPSPPAQNEAVESYLNRLANTNHVAVAELKIHLGLNPTAGAGNLPPPALNRLAILTGRSPTELAQALPELGNRILDPEQFSLNRRDACPACTRRHRGGRVFRFFPDYVHVCARHRLWIREPTHQGRLLDISAVPAILTAQTRHRRLARRYGARATEHAFQVARDSWQYVRHLPKSVDTALGTFCPDNTRIFGNDPVFLAATYPDTVALTTMLVSPYWRRLAADPDTRKQFYAEAGWRTRRDRHYLPKRNDTLHHWAEDLATEGSKLDESALWQGLFNPMGVWRRS